MELGCITQYVAKLKTKQHFCTENYHIDNTALIWAKPSSVVCSGHLI